MASSTANVLQDTIDIDTDYGSDFSWEEEHLINQLLSPDGITPHKTSLPDIEDNPIVNDLEWHDAPQTLRIPRPRAVDRQGWVGEDFVQGATCEATTVLPIDPGYPDCKISMNLTASISD